MIVKVIGSDTAETSLYLLKFTQCYNLYIN